MATDIVTGLFGLDPNQIQAQRQAETDKAAYQYAQLDPFARASMSMYKAGAGLARPIAGMMGGYDPEEQKAITTQRVMADGNVDLSTSQGMLMKADQFRKAGDIRTATALAIKGKELEKQEQAAALASRKQDFQENQQFELNREVRLGQLENQREQLKMREQEAKLKSEDTRLAIEQRREAAAQADATRRMIAQMTSAIASLKIAGDGTPTPPKNLSPVARLKWELDNGLITQEIYDTAMAGTPGGKAKGVTDKDQKAALAALKAAGYDPETGEDKISKLINESTGGAIESTGAKIAGAFGLTTTGAAAINTLAAASSKITTDLLGGKLGAGISNSDRDFIVAQLGDVANPDKPRGARLAAWTYAKERMMEVGLLPTTRQTTVPSTKAPVSAVPAAPKTVKWGELAK